ncbi:MAG TPA: hypothetical protein VE046_06555 [Steroidobacteraceae bacterium]|nr:hypothetical protein [Steroidobacteraceae bacterium]
MVFLPEIDGTLTIRSEPETFLRAFHRRAKSGLLTGSPQRRSSYCASMPDAHHLSIRAADWKSAINVGLNDLDLEWAGKATLKYRVRYWRWTLFCVGLGAVLAALGITFVLAFDARAYLAQGPESMRWGLSVDQSVRLLWVFIGFWGFVWPWLLVALHKRPLHRLVQQLAAAVDEAAVSSQQ